MDRQNVAYLAFNRGLISRLALARADVKRTGLSAQVYVNYAPRSLGSMMLRPGLAYKGDTRDDLLARYLPFVFSTTDKALLELTSSNLRVWINDALVTRPAVTTVVQNDFFNANLNNWTDDDEVGGTSAWVAGGYMGLTGNGAAAAIRTQAVDPAANAGVEHALKIAIARGPVTLRVGTAAGDDSYIRETALDTGNHSLAFTPTGIFYIRFQSRLSRQVLVDVCTIEGAGPMQVPTPWGDNDLANVRGGEKAQSGDIVFAACAGMQQRKIERRATHSWSVVNYMTEDGPFRVMNVTEQTMTPSVLTGNGTLTSSIAFFRTGHVGALFAVTSTGQAVQKNIAAQNVFSDPIEVTGVGTDRNFVYTVTSITGSGTTATLQRSFGAPGTWVDVGAGIVADITTSLTDGFDNQIVYYRLGVKTGAYAAGPIDVSLSIATGSIRGICRVTGYTSTTVVAVEILKDMGGTAATADWEEGKWSDYRGWPSAGAFVEGRLEWAGKDSTALSVSDGFYSYDPTVVGDSGPILRSIGSGPVDTINWVLPLQRLTLGGQGAEFVCKSSSLDEPLTPTNFNIKKCSRQGSANVDAVEVDTSGVYVQRGGIRVFELVFDPTRYDYNSVQLSTFVPRIGYPGITRMAVQRQPDIRIHFVRSDGTAAILLMDKNEGVNCWFEVETQGAIEDVVVLPGDPGDEEDQVYYVVRRSNVNGQKRFLERWARESECWGDAVCRIADAHITFSGLRQIVTGLDHLEGLQVVVWADGKDVGHDANDNLIYTVAGGKITLLAPATQGAVGLPYTAQWQSGKLVEIQSQYGTGIKDQKNIQGLGLILDKTHRKGVKFGQDFTNMDDLPSIEQGAPVGDDVVHDTLDENWIIFPGTWDVDARLCLESMAPRPATILAAVCQVENH